MVPTICAENIAFYDEKQFKTLQDITWRRSGYCKYFVRDPCWSNLRRVSSFLACWATLSRTLQNSERRLCNYFKTYYSLTVEYIHEHMYMYVTLKLSLCGHSRWQHSNCCYETIMWMHTLYFHWLICINFPMFMCSSDNFWDLLLVVHLFMEWVSAGWQQ